MGKATKLRKIDSVSRSPVKKAIKNKLLDCIRLVENGTVKGIYLLALDERSGDFKYWKDFHRGRRSDIVTALSVSLNNEINEGFEDKK